MISNSIYCPKYQYRHNKILILLVQYCIPLFEQNWLPSSNICPVGRGSLNNLQMFFCLLWVNDLHSWLALQSSVHFSKVAACNEIPSPAIPPSNEIKPAGHTGSKKNCTSFFIWYQIQALAIIYQQWLLKPTRAWIFVASPRFGISWAINNTVSTTICWLGIITFPSSCFCGTPTTNWTGTPWHPISPTAIHFKQKMYILLL